VGATNNDQQGHNTGSNMAAKGTIFEWISSQRQAYILVM
jgi:hypothetical protein